MLNEYIFIKLLFIFFLHKKLQIETDMIKSIRGVNFFMKIWKIIKFFVYIISAIMIAIFNLEIVENLKYLIGFLMIIYGLEPVIIHFATRKKFTEHTKFYWDL